MKVVFLLCIAMLFACLISNNAAAQDKRLNAPVRQSGYVKPLKIGDKMPDVLLKNLINYPATSAKLSDFKGKGIILDFWNKGCYACIQAFPKMEALQDQFKDDLQVLCVTRDSRAELKTLLANSPIIKSTKLPFVISDIMLSRLFPYRNVPHHVWINAQGEVKAITSGYNATPENVKKLIEGKDLDMSVKQELLYSNYVFKSLNHFNTILEALDTAKLVSDNLQFSSTLYKRFNGYNPGGFGVLSDSASGKWIGFRIFNQPVVSLYKYAYDFRFENNRVLLNVKSPEKYRMPADQNNIDQWKKENLFIYELKVPLACSDSIKKFIKQDLERYFGITAYRQVKNMRCLVLERVPGTSIPASRLKPQNEDGTIEEGAVEKTKETYVMEGIYTSDLINIITNELKLGIPIIDETGYKDRMDLNISSGSFQNLASLGKELAKYGFRLAEAERKMEVLILTENK